MLLQWFYNAKRAWSASKIKLKNSNKKRTVTARRVIFFYFPKHPFLIILHCCFHHNKTLKALAAIVVLTPPPPYFYHFRRLKFNLQPVSFTFETFSKKLAKTKIVARVKAKIEKRLLNCLWWSGNDFFQNLSITVKICSFWAAAEALLICYE